MSKGFWIIIGIIVVIFGGVVLFKGDEANAPTDGDSSGTISNHVTGENAKGVVLLEYGDFQCSACAVYYPIVEQIVKKYEKDIQFQFRHLPLTTVHKNAFASSRAAEAAGLQNKFFEMYRLLYENQNAWAQSNNPLSIFEGYATQLGLDATKFKADYASSTVNGTINADIAEFKKTGEAMSTPTFFLNGKKIKPATPEEFDKLVADEIAKKSQQ